MTGDGGADWIQMQVCIFRGSVGTGRQGPKGGGRRIEEVF